ncbi:multimeric flavodoxin WrbA [Clostridium baratii]|uniref:flavodoxin family protein n=1 Tax=Clostridium baratii TaxID=1561 RepID=UPI0006C68721|nr:NAD(P)H-dependent oxidoreductase [Clostridium baratii]CUP12942.1 multimeric flavodoxin WrbA [Clostridium baratii]
MKCLIIHGSPRRKNTWDVLNIVKEQLNTIDDIQFDLIELKKEKLDICIGCFNCILKGEDKCPHFNKTKTFIDKINESDVIILTSPVYSMQVSGLMKNFIDHMSYNFHRPKLYNKKALVITTTAGAGHKESSKYLKKVLEFWGISKVYKIPVAYRAEYLTEKNKKYIENVANKFKEEILKSNKPKAKTKQVVMYNFWRSTTKNNSDLADYKFYKDKNYVYFKDAKISVLNRVIGNLTYKIIK